MGNITFLEAMWLGQFDGALVQLERAFMPTYGDTSPGTVILFAGRVSDIDCSRTGVDLRCRSHLELLNIQMPRRLWQSSCTHTFGDAMCQFDRTGLQETFACLEGSTSTSIATGVAPSPSTLYDQGTIVGVGGANAGSSRTISQLADGYVSVRKAFLSAVVPGDLFQLLPGCDRTFATCTSVFNNAVHFGGFPSSRRLRRRYDGGRSAPGRRPRSRGRLARHPLSSHGADGGRGHRLPDAPRRGLPGQRRHPAHIGTVLSARLASAPQCRTLPRRRDALRARGCGARAGRCGPVQVRRCFAHGAIVVSGRG